MLIYHYHPKTGQYLYTNLADEDPQHQGRWLIPAFATATPLPEHSPLTWPVWQNEQWILLPDYRGYPLYRTDNGEPSEILKAGFTPQECGLTDKFRPSSEHVWCDGDWVIDTALVTEQKRTAAMTEFEARMDKARFANLGKADALVAGLLDELGVRLFKAWAAYQMVLVSVIEAPDFPAQLNWPNEPDQQAIAKEIATAR